MHPMTVLGEELLREELERLKGKERPRIIEDIARAREHGDLRENAEYKAAREEQGMVEARIRLIETRLGSAQIIDITQIAPSGRVIFGTTVSLVRKDDGVRFKYQIVGEDEADVNQNKLSYASPLARALMGKEVGIEVELQLPAGSSFYLIEEVEHI